MKEAKIVAHDVLLELVLNYFFSFDGPSLVWGRLVYKSPQDLRLT